MIGSHRRVARAGLALATLVAGPARADEPRTPPAPRARFGLGEATRPPPPNRHLFELGAAPARPATCEEARSLPCPSGPEAAEAAPAAVTTRRSAARLARLPLGDADLDDAAGLVVGAGRDDLGPFFAGATGAEHRWLLDGAPIESARSGALATRVPLAFLDAVTVTTGGFSARDAATTGAVIDATLREGGERTRAVGAVWLGAGLTPRPLPRARGEYRPFEGRLEDLRTLSAVAVGDGTLAQVGGARLWWAAGVAPRLDDQSLIRDAFRRVDRDGDGGPDTDRTGRLVHERIGTLDRDGLGYSVPVLARLGLRGAHQQLALTALVTAGRELRWTPMAEDSAAGVERELRGADVSATWRGRWGATAARAQASWHRDGREEAAHAGGDPPSIGYAYVPAPSPGLTAGDAAVRAACEAGGAFASCPIETGYYATGGVGRTIDTVQDRPRVTAELTHTLAEHTLSLGVSGEDARLRLRNRFSGGFLRQQLGEGAFLDYRLVAIDIAGTDTCGVGIACRWLDVHERTIRTRHAALWLADTWRPGPAIAVEYGVRGETSRIGESVRVHDVLPRLGAAWDFLGKGRARGYAGWGRYAALLPAGAGERIFGGPSVYQEITFGDQRATGLAVPDDLPVYGQPRGVRIDEALAGVEVGLADVARVGGWARHRHLGRTLEDDQGQLTTGGHLTGVRATRDLTELAITAENAPTAQVHVRAGYAWSRLRGNWPGPWDPFEGLTLYTSSLFAAAPTNATGPLPGDQPHRFFAELAGGGHAWGFALEASVRATAASGRAISTRGRGETLAFLLPRGSGGRLPTVAQTNLHLGARRGRVAVMLDVFNLFDRRGVTAVDELYTPDAQQPIAGGDASDLVFLKDAGSDGQAPRTSGRYGQATRYQVPLAVHLGVRLDL